MLKAVELPTSIADLATGLANVDADALSLARDNLLRKFGGYNQVVLELISGW